MKMSAEMGQNFHGRRTDFDVILQVYVTDDIAFVKCFVCFSSLLYVHRYSVLPDSLTYQRAPL